MEVPDLLDHDGRRLRAAAAAPGGAELLLRLPALLGEASPGDPLGSARTRLRRNRTALEGARTLCHAARNAGVPVTVAAGPRTDVGHLLALVRDLRQDFPGTGVLLHAALLRAEADCAELAGSRVRLASGRPRGAPDAVLETALARDKAFVRCLRLLLAGAGTPVVDTADERLLRIARTLARRAGREPGDWEVAVPADGRAGRGRVGARRRPAPGSAGPAPLLRPTLVVTPGCGRGAVRPAVRGAAHRLAGATGDLTQFARSLDPRRR